MATWPKYRCPNCNQTVGEEIKLTAEVEQLRARLWNYKHGTAGMCADAAIGAAKEWMKEVEALRAELERERGRLAACGVAALGHYDGCADQYKSASLDDVLTLRARVKELEGECEYDQRNAAMSQKESAMLLDKLAACEKERDGFQDQCISIKLKLAASQAENARLREELNQINQLKGNKMK